MPEVCRESWGVCSVLEVAMLCGYDAGSGANGSRERPHPHCHINDINGCPRSCGVHGPWHLQLQPEWAQRQPPRLSKRLQSAEDLSDLQARTLRHLIRLEHLVQYPTGCRTVYQQTKLFSGTGQLADWMIYGLVNLQIYSLKIWLKIGIKVICG